jgi:hypothetical protein
MTHAVRRAVAEDEEAARAIIDEYNTASYAGTRSNGFAREEPRC